jgi:hypothetical protein
MKSSAKLVAIALFVVLALSACTTFQISGIQVAKNTPSTENVGDFEVEVKIWEYLGSSGGSNLGNISATAMDGPIYDAIQKEIEKKSGDAAIDVTIIYQATFLDVVINSFTGSILAPATAKISGTIVKYN